jgi:hypothetical protein
VSFFWIANFVGAFAAGMLNVYLTDRLGFGIVRDHKWGSGHKLTHKQVTPMAAMLQFTAYVLASFAPPYPIFVSVFIFNGMGFGLQDALANVSSVVLVHIAPTL